ncbi:MAG: 2-oxo acid dehydrogenase subunit E2 [Candidatus Hydrogenedentota bacterium]
MATNFTLPELGENIEKGAVAKILVAKGDRVAKGQPVLELETDKAVVEVPCPVAGTVAEIRVQEGGVVRVGEVVMVIDEAIGAAQAEAPKPSPKPAVVVAQPEAPKPAVAVTAPAGPLPAAIEAPIPTTPTPTGPPDQDRLFAAPPSVRKLAREIGVDIATVRPSSGSRITAEDVKAHARGTGTVAAASPTPAAPAGVSGRAPGSDRWGPTDRQKMSGVRRKTAERMTAAWNTIPHVTQHDKADVTDLEAFRKKYGAQADGVKLTATAIITKVVVAALKKFPQFNATLDEAAEEIVLRRYYNIGIAADTDRGLLVPVIKRADEKGLLEIAQELTRLSEAARSGKIPLDDLQGATFTITNLGGIGGTGFTPIINSPEVAILGVSRANVEPVYRDGQFVPRTMMPLSLSYDHRVIDGADAARFTRWLCEALEQPYLAMLEG